MAHAGNMKDSGTVTWEKGDVPCPVCERNEFVESQAEEVRRKSGFEGRFPVWDAYYCLWDLPPLERKRRVAELGEEIRRINERKKAESVPVGDKTGENALRNRWLRVIRH